MEFKEKLMQIQTELKAPKNLYNSFGKYKYRNAEGIQEALKPYLNKYGCTLILSDKVEQYGERIYIKATAILYDIESDERVIAEAYAREALEKKGMDESQITGTASSYARKYALNGLFLLDDTKDADSDEYKQSIDAKNEQAKDEEKFEQVAKSKITPAKVQVIEAKIKADKIPLENVLTLYKIKKLEDMTEAQFSNISNNWEKVKSWKPSES